MGVAEDLVNLLYAQRQLQTACLERSIEDIEAALEKIYLGTRSIIPPAEGAGGFFRFR